MKIVGKILLSLVCFAAVLNAQVRLNVQTMDGRPLVQAGIGQPFMLEVVREGASSQLSSPDIKGLEPFVVKNSGLQMRTSNGVSTVKYQYILRSDSSGTFTIGPAILSIGNQRVYSNQITLLVDTIEQAKKEVVAATKNKEPAFMRLKLDKQNVVVGEKIVGTIRFYSADGSILFHDLHVPDFSAIGLDVCPHSSPEQSVEQINGHSYSYAEWSWCGYPTKEGEIVVPAYWAEYFTNQARGGFFSQFFNRVFKRVYSNAVTLTVDPLPDTTKKVDAVGHYIHFNAKIDPSATKQGDAMILTLELVGDGDLERLSAPTVRGVPSGLRVYESKNSLVDDMPDQRYIKKRFEYVVQALQSGDFEIPAQKFFYFDTKKRRYTTLSTGSLFVTVLPGPVEQAPLADSPTASVLETVEDDIKPLVLSGPWQSPKQFYSISLYLFLILFLAPLVWSFAVYRVYPLIIIWYRRWYWAHKQVAYNHAKKSLARACSAQNYAALYPVFISFFSQRWGIPIEQINQHYIEEKLRSVLSTDELRNWQIFFNKVMQAAFFKNQSSDHDGFSLFEQARSWRVLFKERL